MGINAPKPAALIGNRSCVYFLDFITGKVHGDWKTRPALVSNAESRGLSCLEVISASNLQHRNFKLVIYWSYKS